CTSQSTAVGATALRPGSCVIGRVEELRRGTAWAEVHSTPRVLAYTPVEPDTELVMYLPPDLEPGRHTLYVRNVAEDGLVDIYAVGLTVAKPLPWWWLPLAGTSGVAATWPRPWGGCGPPRPGPPGAPVLAGLFLLWRVRRRRPCPGLAAAGAPAARRARPPRREQFTRSARRSRPGIPRRPPVAGGSAGRWPTAPAPSPRCAARRSRRRWPRRSPPGSVRRVPARWVSAAARGHARSPRPPAVSPAVPDRCAATPSPPRRRPAVAAPRRGPGCRTSGRG